MREQELEEAAQAVQKEIDAMVAAAAISVLRSAVRLSGFSNSLRNRSSVNVPFSVNACRIMYPMGISRR